MTRKYELFPYKGTAAEYHHASERRALVGKRVGYDLCYSCVAHYGVVTGADARGIEIDHSHIPTGSIQQIVVLDDQPEQGDGQEA